MERLGAAARLCLSAVSGLVILQDAYGSFDQLHAQMWKDWDPQRDLDLALGQVSWYLLQDGFSLPLGPNLYDRLDDALENQRYFDSALGQVLWHPSSSSSVDSFESRKS